MSSASKDSRMAAKLIELIQEEYPSGDMPVDSILVVFGMAIAAALSASPIDARRKAAEMLTEKIVNTPEALQAYSRATISVTKLQQYRRKDLEAKVFEQQGQEKGDVAGDMPMHSTGRSIRFSVQQYDEGIDGPFISLSAENHTLVTDKEAKIFIRMIDARIVEELPPRTPGTFVRSFKIEPLQ